MSQRALRPSWCGTCMSKFLGGNEHEATSRKIVEGRRRPGPDRVCSASGVALAGGGWLNRWSGDRNQRHFRERERGLEEYDLAEPVVDRLSRTNLTGSRPQ